MRRAPWNTYFLELADLVSTRATCPRASHGAVITKDKRIVSTGYNGAPTGEAHCTDVGCEMEAGHCVRTIHAEENAIIAAAKNGVSVEGASIYVTARPCPRCRVRIRQSGIKFVHFRREYENGSETDISESVERC